mmetsp:Transcript_35135/g.90275  ORF Transcript_35135/g.90275 Transcript_35135/m.90275 type:complete len:250 (+) Transcript_35135:985-1734(+)
MPLARMPRTPTRARPKRPAPRTRWRCLRRTAAGRRLSPWTAARPRAPWSWACPTTRWRPCGSRRARSRAPSSSRAPRASRRPATAPRCVRWRCRTTTRCSCRRAPKRSRSGTRRRAAPCARWSRATASAASSSQATNTSSSARRRDSSSSTTCVSHRPPRRWRPTKARCTASPSGRITRASRPAPPTACCGSSTSPSPRVTRRVSPSKRTRRRRWSCPTSAWRSATPRTGSGSAWHCSTTPCSSTSPIP